jgi:hypothetical protein
MTFPDSEASGRAGGAGAIVAASAIVFVIALAAFQAISANGPGADHSAELPAADRWPPDSAPSTFSDPDLGLAVAVPSAWERTFEPAATAGANARVTFRDPSTAARLELEAWDAVGLAPFGLWLGVVAGGMTPVSEEPLPNASLAGTPAWVLWHSASPDAPAAYAAFLERDGRYYRFTYYDEAGAGGVDFRRVLASVAWPTGTGAISIPNLPPAAGP